MKAYSFDKETRTKLMKSLALSLASGVSAFLTSYANGGNAKTSALIGASALLSFLINAPILYIRGDGEQK